MLPLFLMLLTTIVWSDPSNFEKANELARKGEFLEALELYRLVAKEEPENLEVLYNAGLAAYMSQNYDVATQYWSDLNRRDPGNSRVLSKLVQAGEALGQDTSALRKELKALFKSGANPEFTKERCYVREQFQANGKWVMVFEFPEPDYEKREHTWDFVVLGEDREQEAMYYFMFDAMASEVGKTKTYFLDIRWAQGGRRNLVVFTRLPDYDEVRGLVKKSMAGEKLPRVIQ